MSSSDAKIGKGKPLVSRFNGRGMLYAFVYRTAQRRIYSLLRQQRKTAASSLDDGSLEAMATDTDRHVIEEIKAAVAAALKQCDERERIVLRMTCAGCSNSEIAARITPPGRKPVHDGRISHIRKAAVQRIRTGLGELRVSLPFSSTLISDLLDASTGSEEVS